MKQLQRVYVPQFLAPSVNKGAGVSLWILMVSVLQAYFGYISWGKI